MVPTPTVNDDVIQTLEDERMVSDVPLLVLSGEVFILYNSPDGRITHNQGEFHGYTRKTIWFYNAATALGI